MDKNSCQTISHYDELGNPVFKHKVRYSTHDKAIKVCKTLNLKEGQFRKLVTYKCKVCHTYHIGRNSTIIDKKYLDKIRRENNKGDLSKRQIQLKIIGKIEL